MLRILIFAATVVAFALVSARASAGEPPPRVAVRLKYERIQGTQACPDETLFRRFLLGAFGYDPIAEVDDPILTVRLSREGRQVRGDLSLRKDGAVVWSETHRASMIECQEFVDSLAVSIESFLAPLEDEPAQHARPVPLAERSSMATRPVESEKTPSIPVSVPSPSGAMPRDLVAQTSEAKEKPWSGYAGAQSFVYSWGLPDPVVAVGASIGGRWEFLSASLEGRYYAPARADIYTVDAFGGSLVPCAHYRILHGCGVLSLAWAHIQGDDTSTRGLLVLGGTRVGVDLPIWGPLLVRIDGELAGRLSPYLGAVCQGVGNCVPRSDPAPVTFGVGLGVLAHF